MLQLLKQKISGKFLLIFSALSITVAGIVWACGGGDYYDDENSSFTPEAFVDPQYSPFFYESSTTYYGSEFNDNGNTRFNKQVVDDWYAYLDKKVGRQILDTLLIKSSQGFTDSVYRNFKGKLKDLPAGMPDLSKSNADEKQLDLFLSYLTLAKACESYAVNQEYNYWDEKPKPKAVAAELGNMLTTAYAQTKDVFVKQRLWFQLVRYYYYQQKQESSAYTAPKLTLPDFFAQEEAQFPKNIMYYRTMGYLAGYYYQHGEFARANYLYSLCYNYSFEMKIPSKWSFRPQNESDWTGTLKLAQNGEEKITLWHLLGISQDPVRAIREIYAINPKSDKLDLLLSRLINSKEQSISPVYSNEESKNKTIDLKTEISLVANIAKENKTRQPFYWNLAAGYLNALSHQYVTAKTFYNVARKQLPKDNKLILAQYKILDWTLYLQYLKKIDAAAEAKMAEPLTWLYRLSQGKDAIPDLRFHRALDQSLQLIAALYKKQGDLVKSNCFEQHPAFYLSNTRIEAMKTLLAKPKKSPFEIAMLNYCNVKIENLYYLQATQLVYQEKLDQALVMMKKAEGINATLLLGNPFNIRINDCHDCDHAAPGKTRYTAQSFLETMINIKAQLTAGKDVSRNAALLANAYYNITHYGNARYFYQSDITGSITDMVQGIDEPFRHVYTDNHIAEKYYLLARTNAKTKELKAKFTFMASKCDHNNEYNRMMESEENRNSWYFQLDKIPTGKYFAELMSQYSQTNYYREVLNECGYFSTYVSKRR